MPLYEYECKSCPKVFEIMQKFSDAPLTECPTCGKEVKKLVSRTSFQLKGTGWYATDYKKGTTSSSQASETKPEKASEGASSAGKKAEDS